MDLEAVDPRHVHLVGGLGHQLGVRLQEEVRERGAKVGAVDTSVVELPWLVHILTPWAEHLHCFHARQLLQSDRQARLLIAQHSGAPPKHPRSHLLAHGRQTR
eukprot:Mycagemm_TRINITY_DN10339_c3_g4::TRINITY_DN10339_c3_g4_i1::g.951::m.951 type:complete len:103 gc:universal TRINITY_DN10339_c3_g4_i1:490-182(-)